jgi:hypothetical protein
MKHVRFYLDSLKGNLIDEYVPSLTCVLMYQSGDPIPTVKEAVSQAKGAIQQQSSGATYSIQVTSHIDC